MPGFPKVNGIVSAVVSDGQGGWFIAGEFTEVGGLPRANLAHITAQRTVNPLWNPTAVSHVRKLALHGNRLYYVAGDLDDAPTDRSGIKALDASSGAALPFNVSVNGTVNALVATPDRVFAAGYFTQALSSQSYNLAAFDLAGNPLPWDPRVNEEISSMVLDNNTLYIAGRFSMVGGQGRNALAAIDASTAAVTSWNPNASHPNNQVGVLSAYDRVLYVAGYFTEIQNQPRASFAAFDIATGQLTPLQAEKLAYNNSVLAVGPEVIVLGGVSAYTFDPAKDRLLVVLDRLTGKRKTMQVEPSLGILTAAATSGEFFIGGFFSMVQGSPRLGAAAFDAATGTLTPWDPKVGTNVLALAVAGDKVIIAGELNSIGGQARKHIGVVDRVTGALDPNWRADPDFGVIDLAVYQDRLYVGGVFRNISGVGRTNIAALDLATGAVLPWDPLLNRAMVRAVTISGDTLYIGGLFRSVGAVTRNRAAAFDLTTGELTAWNPNITSSSVVEDIEVAGSTVYLGGRFSTVNGVFRTNAVAVTLSGEVLPWAPNPDRPVYDIAVAGDKVFLTGEFEVVDDQRRHALAAVDNNEGRVLPWDPSPQFFGNCVTVAGDQLYVGGVFYRLFDEVRMGFASFQLSNQDTRPPPQFDLSALRYSQGAVLLRFSSTPGASYTLQISPDATDWRDVAVIAATTDQTSFQDNTASARTQTFYRLILR